MRVSWIMSLVCVAVAATGWIDITCGFESDKEGAVPAGFSVAETASGGKPATWGVRTNGLASCGRNFVTMSKNDNTGSTFNMLLLDKVVPANATLSVRLRADGGDEDSGGGLAWRVVDNANYYVARWNPLEKNLRAYKVVEGKRSTAFGSVTLEGDATVWHALKVRCEGAKCSIFFDGAPVLEFSDETFKEGGKVALWTKADACTQFDDLEISAYTER